jgi:hypothetical protein
MKRIFTLFAALFFISLTAEAQTQASGIHISPFSGVNTSLRLDWTNGTGTNRIVIFKTAASTYSPTNLATAPTSVATALVSAFPTNDLDGTSETAACIFNSAVDGSGTTVRVTGLVANTEYTIQIYEYTGTGASTTYTYATNSSNPVSVRFYTATGQPFKRGVPVVVVVVVVAMPLVAVVVVHIQSRQLQYRKLR